MANPPFVPQGTLNKVRCSIVVSNNPALNITASYMGKSYAKLSFSGVMTNLIPTATGAVTSPEPYVISTVTVSILKTQALAAAWIAQVLNTGVIGPITVYPDSSAFPNISLDSAVVDNWDPDAFDGMSPVVRLTLRGVYYINANLWNLT
jgi:hypothetical protein